MSVTPSLTPPNLALFAFEPLRAGLEFARHHLTAPVTAHNGDGHAVVLFPGFGADDLFMRPLAAVCEKLGFMSYRWGRGRNSGPAHNIRRWLDTLAADIDMMTANHSHDITLIGWSLGGLYAREVAKALPKRVRQVITLGTPSNNISCATRIHWLYEFVNGSSKAVSKKLAMALGTPPSVPTTSIYSRTDGVVAWKACRLVPGPLAENVEVDSSHVGLVWHPDVMQVIADRLVRPQRCLRPRTINAELAYG